MDEGARNNFESYLQRRSGDIEHVIHELWASKDEKLWSSDPYFYIRLGETADKLGQVMFAHDVLREGLSHFPDNLRINQLYALSMIKCGFLGKAHEVLGGLVKKGHKDEETLGILGRVYKDMWLISNRSLADDTYLRKSRDLYFQAFRRSRGYYSGINAASLSLMLGERDRAERLAETVLGICFNLLKKPENRDYWCLATVGEGFIVLGDNERARRYFTLARRVSAKNYAWVASTRKQIKLLSRYTDVSDETLNILTVPPVVAFTGHMVDHPGRNSQRFPPIIADELKREIASKLRELGAGIGYSSAACGSDILFLECMQERKAETNVVLPFDLEDFFKTSVEFAGPQWTERAHSVLERSATVLQATEGKYGGDDLLFNYANDMIMGMAILRSNLLETEPVLLTVWDRKRNRASGGTYEFIHRWEAKKLRMEVIDLNRLLKAHGGKIHQAYVTAEHGELGAAQAEARSGKRRWKRISRSIKAMLFADLVGYSTLKEDQFPSYINNFLGTLAAQLTSGRYRPLFRNMWGDALYFVFDDPVSAAECALELRSFVKETEWGRMNLPGGLNIRIGLHAGPVFYAKEPILKKTNYFGTHVNRAARIEPITNPGNVYASEQFAALLMAGDIKSNLECRYVGIIVLPKRFGKYPIYHIKRKDELE